MVVANKKETTTMSKYKLTIFREDRPENPREWSDEMGTMACSHSRYNLGDYSASIDDVPHDDDTAVVLPLYLYDHSGITMSTKPFSCPWDSGQVGYIYTTMDNAKKWLGNDVSVERIIEVLKGEVETYDTYLCGDIYGYHIEEGTNCDCCGNIEWESIDSCGMFFGNDHKASGLVDAIKDDIDEDVYPIIEKALDDDGESVYYDTDVTVTVEKK
jgi:hypothetical protein